MAEPAGVVEDKMQDIRDAFAIFLARGKYVILFEEGNPHEGDGKKYSFHSGEDVHGVNVDVIVVSTYRPFRDCEETYVPFETLRDEKILRIFDALPGILIKILTEETSQP